MLVLLRAIVITQGQLPGCSPEVGKHLDDSGGPMHTKIRKGLKTFLKNYYSDLSQNWRPCGGLSA